MIEIIHLLQEPWPWYVAGPLIAFIMGLLLFFGKSFGFSGNFRTICAACGAGKNVPFFAFDWKRQRWNLYFMLGSLIGGWITAQWLNNGTPVQISDQTIQDLALLGIAAPEGLQPNELFRWESSTLWKQFILWSLGGLLIGFGTRWAGGCTSGHAISGLSDLQWPSLLAVIGFFTGGLIMTHLLLPLFLPL